MTRVLLILLVTLALTASEISAMALGTACWVSAETCLLQVPLLMVPGVAQVSDGFCSLWVSYVALSAMICSKKCSLADRQFEISTNISITTLRVGSVSTGWLWVLLNPVGSSPWVEEKVEGSWPIWASYLALLLDVTALAAPFFFTLLLGGMVEVERDEKNMSHRYWGVRHENSSSRNLGEECLKGGTCHCYCVLQQLRM